MVIKATVFVFLLYLLNCSLAEVKEYQTDGFIETTKIKAGKNFLLGSDEVNFFRAYFNCKEAGMELANILSSNDEQDLAYFLNRENRTGGFWISGTNLADISSTQFSWLTGGKRAIYTNWLADEPNNEGGDENCIQWVERGNTGWNDCPCQQKRRYICQDPE